MRARFSRPARLALMSLGLLLVGVARLWPHYDSSAAFPLHPEAVHLARSLAFHHRFADPFRLLATGPSAYLSPAFPAFLAMIIRAFGTGAQAAFAFRLAATVATAAELALLPVFTETIGIGFGPGALACLMGLLPPMLTFPDWEMSYAGLLIVIATLLGWTARTNSRAHWVSSALLGVIAGVLLLTSATVLPVLVAWLAFAVWKFRWNAFRRGRWVAPLIVVVMLVPWTVRNYFVFRRVIPFRTALGLALEASNNDCALVGVRQSEASGCFGRHSPNHNMTEAVLARSLGETEYNAVKLHETLQWISSHPARFGKLAAQRTYAFWFPHEGDSLSEEFTKPDSRRKERLTIYLATVLSLPGLVTMFKANRDAALILTSWLVFFPLIYYIALYEDRYRYPILWVTFVCAGYAICKAATFSLRVFGARDAATSPQQESRAA